LRIFAVMYASIFRARVLGWGLSCLAVLPAAAEGLRWSGYGTLGLVHVSAPADWRFRRDISQRGEADSGVSWTPDTRLGLQLNWQPHEQLELVAQGVLRRRARTAPAVESLEWAFASWRPTPALTVRVGRTSPDVFLLADYRNVGFAYPWVRPPVEAYGWMPLFSMDGADVAYQWPTRDGRWFGRFYAGRARTTLAGGDGYADPRVRTRSLVGGTISHESGGLTLKLSGAVAKTQLDDTVGLAQAKLLLQQLAQAQLPVVSAEAAALNDHIGELKGFRNHYLSLGATWDRGPWQLQGEWSRIGGSYRAQASTFAYGSVAYRRGSVTWFGLASRAWPTHPLLPSPQWGPAVAPLVGPVMAMQIQALGEGLSNANNVARNDQHTVGAGLRWDVAPNAAVKLQVDRVHVHAHGSALWSNTRDNESARATVFSAALDFVF